MLNESHEPPTVYEGTLSDVEIATLLSISDDLIDRSGGNFLRLNPEDTKIFLKEQSGILPEDIPGLHDILVDRLNSCRELPESWKAFRDLISFELAQYIIYEVSDYSASNLVGLRDNIAGAKEKIEKLSEAAFTENPDKEYLQIVLGHDLQRVRAHVVGLPDGDEKVRYQMYLGKLLKLYNSIN